MEKKKRQMGMKKIQEDKMTDRKLKYKKIKVKGEKM